MSRPLNRRLDALEAALDATFGADGRDWSAWSDAELEAFVASEWATLPPEAVAETVAAAAPPSHGDHGRMPFASWCDCATCAEARP